MEEASTKPVTPLSGSEREGEVQPRRSVVIETGVDWLTCSCTERKNRVSLQELAAALLHDERQAGNDIAPWTFMGFEGLKAGGVGFGDIDEMSLMRLSGPTAFKHWRTAYELATNVSRIDAQVTVRTSCIPQELVLRHHAQAIDHVAERKRKPAVDLRLSNVKPPTLYLNTRSSSRFGRVYDKGGESKLDHYKGCARFEVQFNGKTGLYAARFIAASSTVEEACEGMVTAFFAERGLELEWERVERRSLTTPRRRTDALRRLSWLRRQVAPCIQKLLLEFERREIVAALGLLAEAPTHEDGPEGP